MEQFKNNAIGLISTYGGKLILAVVVLIIGSLVIKALNRMAGRAIDRAKLDEAASGSSRR